MVEQYSNGDVGDWGFTRKLTEHFITEMCKLRVGESDELDSFVKTVTELLKIDEDGK